jgi:hypothetical protein
LPTEKRTGIFWSGGNKAEEDWDNINGFINNQLGGNAMLYFDYLKSDDLKGMGLDPANRGGTYWRLANRSSKGF